MASPRERMLEGGWCPHQINYLAEVFESRCFLFFSKFSRQRPGNHQNCLSTSSCVAYNADMENYTTKHVSDGCSCNMALIPYDRIIEILRTGVVPLISISCQGDDLNLQVTTRLPSSQYVAISHVWADGLGNPHQNALPTCQLRNLRTNLIQTWQGRTRSTSVSYTNPCSC